MIIYCRPSWSQHWIGTSPNSMWPSDQPPESSPYMNGIAEGNMMGHIQLKTDSNVMVSYFVTR